MAFLLNPRFLRSVSHNNKVTIRYNVVPSSLPYRIYCSISSSTSVPPQNQNSPSLEERLVLAELSELLPIRPKVVVEPTPVEPKREDIGEPLSIGLNPDERLRGVFLQKLKGRYFTERALTNARVGFSLTVVANVLDRGNLGGDAMVTFFNWALKQPEVPVDASSYNVLLRALGRRKYADVIEQVLQESNVKGVKLNLESWSIAMDGFVRARRVCKAIEVFEKCEEFGFEHGTESFNALLKCLCKKSHVGRANSYLNLVKGKVDFDVMTYNIVIGGWSKFGRVGNIEKLMEQMAEDGFSANCLTFSYVIEGLGRTGRIEDARKIFDNMGETGCLPDTSVYNAMICNFISVGELKEAMNYYRHLLDAECDPDINTYEKLIYAFIKARKVSDALEMFDQMLHWKICPSTGTITQFLEPLCSFGPPHAAITIYTKARKVGCKFSISAYKLLLMQLSRFGKCGMMSKVWDDMVESGYSFDLELYEYVINGFCIIGQLENASVVMDEALEKGFCPSKLVYSKLNNKLLSFNDVERAYRLFLKFKDARKDEIARRYWRANGWHS